MWDLSSYLEQELPGCGALVSILGDLPAKLKTIEYYPVINIHISDNKAVPECLGYSEDGAKEVGQTADMLWVMTRYLSSIWNKSYLGLLVWFQF